MRYYGRREKLSPEETAANKAAKEQRDAEAMTCQICGGKYLARTGVIAHHGYQRPGWGYQTASCAGARFLPFEVTKDELVLDIGRVSNQRKTTRAYIKRLRSEGSLAMLDEIQLTITYAKYREGAPRFEKPETHYLHGVTRKNWEKKKLECPDAFKNKQGDYNRETFTYEPYTFDTLLARAIAHEEQQVSLMTNYIDHQTQRAQAWKQTHRAGATAGMWEKV